jgi:hypothetical protein
MGLIVEKTKLSLVSMLLLAALNSSAFAISRYECKGLASETIVLAPYQDGSVTLAFDNGPAIDKTVFVHKGDVFVAEFKDLEGNEGSGLLFNLDTVAKNGYEVASLPNRAPFATKMTCWWLQ